MRPTVDVCSAGDQESTYREERGGSIVRLPASLSVPGELGTGELLALLRSESRHGLSARGVTRAALGTWQISGKRQDWRDDRALSLANRPGFRRRAGASREPKAQRSKRVMRDDC